MLPPGRRCTSATGRAGRARRRSSTRSRTRRPSRTRPRISTEASRRASMLPPVSDQRRPCGRVKRSGWASSAARPAAPAPSATVFSTSSSSAMALLDRRLVDQQHLVDQRRAMMASGSVADVAAPRCPRRWCRRPPSTASPARQLRASPDSARSGRRSPRCRASAPRAATAHAGDQAAAADRRPPACRAPARPASISSATVPWPGDHARVVVGMDEDQALALGDQRCGLGRRLRPASRRAARRGRRGLGVC